MIISTMIIIIINDPTIGAQDLRGLGRNWSNCMTHSKFESNRVESKYITSIRYDYLVAGSYRNDYHYTYYLTNNTHLQQPVLHATYAIFALASINS